MQPLEYKNIGEEKHLTFDSIRRLVLKELSDLSEKEARNHIQQCHRCRSIQQSLAFPEDARKAKLPDQYLPKIWWSALILILVAGLLTAAYIFWQSNPFPATSTPLPVEASQTAEAQEDPEEDNQAAPVLEAIDTLAQVNEEPEETQVSNKKFDNYIEQPKNQPQTRLRGIYGKITNDGQPVSGVTVMVPGSKKARVSDATGKYYIQVPVYAQSLIFIHQGKQLVKPLSSQSRRLDLKLNSEELNYPSRPENLVVEEADSID